ncbi:hypothetical protein F1D05_23400 [Kribbella qitaiheensis]|uniref:SGNH hydrolase-type esterase domain-containing protein n=1 Tax=Kribbella qitaiheensis TaxID=1544730 RepID=A0A7G6X249_9ACTN|nr:hypothetical protein [Kribbella qitaiheensis]QNE20314.1 hypothetical protein F1D05_23400 [Kribbella qitaiheensis]
MQKSWKSVKPTRRQIFAAGAVATVASIASTSTAFAADDYGSGELGPWQDLSNAIATPATIRAVRDANGVYMFGDSISVQDGYTLAERLHTDGILLAVHNWSGRPTTPAVDALQDWATTYGMPQRILMATGTNDIFNPPVFAAQVDRTMSIVGTTRTVIWVNVQASRTSQAAAVQLADQRNSGWINLQLADAQKRHPNLKIVHWAEFLAAKPSRMSPTMYLRDGVHTTVPLGQNARNELIAQTIS